MGRKQSLEIDSAPDQIEEPRETAADSAAPRKQPRTKREKKFVSDFSKRRERLRPIWQLVQMLLGWTAALTFCGLLGAGAYAGHYFLKHNYRFALPSPEEPGQDSPGIELQGSHFTSRPAISWLFEADYGRSLFDIPLPTRQQQLQKLDWVKTASISRIWPNRLKVSITERTPVAFVLLTAPGGASRHLLIDGEGELLPIPQGKAEFRLPVISGVDSEETSAMRKRKVKRALAVLSEAGKFADKIAVVDVARLDNAIATYEIDGHALTLHLGSEHFGSRVQTFEHYYPEISQQYSGVTKFDLRLDDRITAMDGVRSAK